MFSLFWKSSWAWIGYAIHFSIGTRRKQSTDRKCGKTLGRDSEFQWHWLARQERDHGPTAFWWHAGISGIRICRHVRVGGIGRHGHGSTMSTSRFGWLWIFGTLLSCFDNDRWCLVHGCIADGNLRVSGHMVTTSTCDKYAGLVHTKMLCPYSRGPTIANTLPTVQ